MGQEECMIERTFLMVKPDGVQRGLVGEIVSRIERRGLKIVGLKLTMVDEDTARDHYAEHVEKPFFKDLVNHIKSGPTVPMVIEGEDTISVVRKMVGSTNPKEAETGTIRGDFGMGITKNIVHASDSPESAKRESLIYFKESELVDYTKIDEEWLYTSSD
ncbi:MAG: nucleoside-diphosphate kinase [Halobacteriota archaeon]|nr:nucleoside-diphosphate kinase [Halobacteriota archaeon]